MSVVVQLRGNQTLDEAFPVASHGWRPFGDRVLVQMRSPKRVTKGGIMLPDESKDYEKWITTVAKVIAIGPLAFRDRTTLEPWPEGVWAKVGDYVRVPKHGGDRWEVALGEEYDTDNTARYAVFRDREVIAGLCEGEDPLRFKDYI